MNKFKKDPELSSVKIGGVLSKLREWVDGSILQVYFLFEVFRFKNVCNSKDNIIRHRNMHLKVKNSGC
jgi:hypothetical protein